jgi:EPS-associated MarR family transcriptional regulator
MLSEEMRYKVLRLLESNPRLSQRDVARELGISLGKVNFCVRALMQRGWIKASNFKNSHNKAAYMYVLTPRGLEAKARLAVRFLVLKMSEYERLRVEIEQIRREAEHGTRSDVNR